MEFFMELLKAALFGVVEGITEWLPISSTGHMILLNEFVHMDVEEDFWNMFLVVIQLGAILAVVLLFWNKIFPFDFTKKGKKILRKDVWDMWFKIVAACIPAAVVGVFFDEILERYLYNPLTVAVMLILFGAFGTAGEYVNKYFFLGIFGFFLFICVTAERKSFLVYIHSYINCAILHLMASICMR